MFFEQCKQSKVRFGKIVINKERLCVNFHSGPSKDWRADWKKQLPNSVDAYEPCFLLFRFDSNHDWILISFADDKASTRDKMLLAATKATFKSEFGQSFIRAEYQVANRNDLALDVFEKRYLVPFNVTSNTTTFPVKDSDDDQPLTHIERELKTVAKDRAVFTIAQQKAQPMRGIQFPIDQDAVHLLKAFATGDIDFIQLSVDTLNEAIKLESSHGRLEVEQLSAEISKQKPRYSLFRFREADGAPIFFIYSIPPSASCTIKELMLFSSCKQPFLAEIEGDCGVKVTKKIEVDSREKIDAETLLSYIGPSESTIAAGQSPQHFDRPPRPGRSGARVTKVAE